MTTESAVELGQAAFYCTLLFGTFVTVLWNLSGVIHVDIGGTVIPIPGFMVFVALIYSAIGTSLALWAGFPLVGASNLRQTVEANFRFGLARAREYSESIALVGGDSDERRHLQELLRGVRRGWSARPMAWCASSCSPRHMACWQTRFRFLSRHRATSWGSSRSAR